MEQLHVLLELNKDATEQSVVQAVQTIMNERDLANTELKEKITELETANAAIEKHEATIASFETEKKAAEKTLVEETVDQAIKDNKLDEKERDNVIGAFSGNLPGLKAVLGATKSSAVTVSSKLKISGEGGATVKGLTEKEKEMTWREWEKKNPKKLKAIIRDNQPLAEELYQAQYNKPLPEAVISFAA